MLELKDKDSWLLKWEEALKEKDSLITSIIEYLPESMQKQLTPDNELFQS